VETEARGKGPKGRRAATEAEGPTEETENRRKNRQNPKPKEKTHKTPNPKKKHTK
jgi:hypothetical protein